MNFSIAGMFGGAIAIFLLSLLVGKFLFKNDEPTTRAVKTVGVALGFASIASGFGAANGGPFVWTSGLTYVPGAVAVFLWLKLQYVSQWTDKTED